MTIRDTARVKRATDIRVADLQHQAATAEARVRELESQLDFVQAKLKVRGGLGEGRTCRATL